MSSSSWSGRTKRRINIDITDRVTGAGPSNDKAIATELAANNAILVANDLEEAPATETAAEIREAGGDAIT